MNPWHIVNPRPGKNFSEINVICEIPAKTKSKYELDKESGLIRLDRVLHSSFAYPANYGFIPQSIAKDGDPLDILIISEEQFLPDTIVRVRVLGMLNLTDDGKIDNKILSVAVGDPKESGKRNLKDISKSVLQEIDQFFRHYKDLERKKVKVVGFKDAKFARAEIKAALQEYKKRFKGRR